MAWWGVEEMGREWVCEECVSRGEGVSVRENNGEEFSGKTVLGSRIS